ncbi:MAG: flagellar hook-length control protein FliK, partial [Betaproteobacteria bacterium]
TPTNAPAKTAPDAGRIRLPAAQAQGDAPSASFLSLLGAMAESAPQVPSADTVFADGGALAQDALQSGIPLQPDLVPAQTPAQEGGLSGLLAASDGAPRPGGHGSGGHRTAMQGGGAEARQPNLSDAAQVPTHSGGHNSTHALQLATADGAQGQAEKSTPPESPRDFMARVEAARTAAATDAATPRTTSAATGVGLSATPQIASMFDASAAGLGFGGLSRGQERTLAKAPAHSAGPGFVAWGDATPAGTSHGASAVYAPGAMTPAPATAMAEKMHYWVSRGVQSAELQLDAFAGGSVDVSISVKGDTAMVEFRTDQPQARQMLLDAMPQLKDLLASEGLMLSGGFVGGSTQQGAPSREREGRAAIARPAAGPARAQAATGSPTRAATGGSVDLFV